MTKLWLRGGKLMTSRGHLIDCPECPCDEATVGTGSTVGVSVTITTGCCPSDPIQVFNGLHSTPLHLTLDSGNTCACLTGSILLDYNFGSDSWIGTGSYGSCGRSATFTLKCNEVFGLFFWTLQVVFSDNCDNKTLNIPSVTCNPLQLVFTHTFTGDCGCGLTSVTYTITL